ncbi:uncharacterized protein si:dkey-75a21.2 [Pygocentrus nattereri]|uniref:uncharacterized protein si:dkey-75a21.2 n=1 Tax=Pygocentrus nattereri TaxID=42514 RepID=UPI000814537D|nr:uncharacterized protein si:dkey-75a21.2 [Pygocentrus nattereri]XP_017548696.1 uncharacterized protein si:dkey-75a21.2 [Pygocentrus nattereri]XP_017548698.1 uncharacterized protein si:dkey-75a21.2 [Pygocentrus nattereri]
MAEPAKACTRKLKPRLSNKERFHCVTADINISQYPALKDWLPSHHEYHICDYKAIRQTQDHLDFATTIRMSLSTVEEIQQFVKDLPITWRIDRTRPPKGQRVLFKVDYRCHHNTKPRKSAEGSGRRTKNTNCPAKMAVTLQRPQASSGRQCRSTDPHMPTLPTIVHITNEHNHNIHVGDALRYKDVGEEAKQKLKKLFEAGHSPSTALDVLKYDLQLEHGDKYANASADRSICPDLQFCYRLYHQVSKQDFATCEGAGMAEALERQIDMYNNQCSDQCTKLTTVSVSPPSTIPPNPDPIDTSQPEEDDSTQTCVMEQEVTKAAEGAEAANPVDKLKSSLAGLCELVEKDSSLWPAAHDLIKGIEKVQHSPAKLASAMHAFGCYSCMTLMTKRAKPLRRRTQTSSVARQKAKLGRHRLAAGRAGKTSGPDHENGQPEDRQ